MKVRKPGLLFLLLVVAVTVMVSRPTLGLRTIPDATTTETGTPVIQIEAPGPAGPISLKTIDPLLLEFREGWKVPDLPGWKVETVGTLKIKLPAGFKISSEISGKNIDAEIVDENGRLFARFYNYQLQGYEIGDLVSQLLGQLFGNKATGEREYEEYKDLKNGKTAYLTRVIMSGETVTYPVILIYNPGEEPNLTTAGEVAIFIFEPKFYPDEPDRISNWIGGMIAGYLEAGLAALEIEGEEIQKKPQVEEQEEKPKEEQKPAVSYKGVGDPFMDKVLSILEGSEPIEHPYDWQEVYGNTFSFYLPYDFSVEFSMAGGLEQMEVADIGYQNYIISKLVVGYKYGFDTPGNYLNQLAGNYLGWLGQYTVGKQVTRGPFDDEGSYVTLYRLDYPSQYAWVALYSKSFDPNAFGPGVYLPFPGLTQKQDAEEWSYYYSNILLSISLDFQ